MSGAAQLIPYLAFVQRSLPAECLAPLTCFAGKILGGVQFKRRAAAERNLSMLGAEYMGAAGSRTIENWTRCLADQIRSLWMRRGELQAMVQDAWSVNLKRAISQGRGLVLVTAHLGNYELAGSYLASFGLPIHAVVEEIEGGHTDAMNRIRRRFGMDVIAYSDVPRMLEVLRRGKILVLLADRDLDGRGLKVRFGKGIRAVPIGPALLALRTGAELALGYFVLMGSRKGYRCVINPAMEFQLKGNLEEKVRTVTERVSVELVQAVKRYPDQWFVFQDEWSQG